MIRNTPDIEIPTMQDIIDRDTFIGHLRGLLTEMVYMRAPTEDHIIQWQEEGYRLLKATAFTIDQLEELNY